MNDRKASIERIPTNKENGFIDVYVSYGKGGVSYSTYKQEPRGYTIHVQPIKVEESNGMICTSFMGFSGIKQHIEGANRFSKKRLNELAQAYKGSDTVQHMIDLVCAKQDITVTESELA